MIGTLNDQAMQNCYKIKISYVMEQKEVAYCNRMHRDKLKNSKS